MSYKITVVPAILAKSYEELTFAFQRLREYAPLIHVDVADGEFVTGQTVGPEALREIDQQVPLEIHLMVKNPLDWVKWYDLPAVERILFHLESFDATEEVINAIREQQTEPGLCLNPETTIESARPFLERVERLQLMTIHPGRQGNELLPQTLPKIDQLKKLYPDLPVSIDGGVNVNTIGRVIEHPVDQIIVGSALTKADNPHQVYDKLVAIATQK